MIQNFDEWLRENYGITMPDFNELSDGYDKGIIRREWDEYLASLSK